MIAAVTDAVLEQASEWQNRPLEPAIRSSSPTPTGIDQGTGNRLTGPVIARGPLAFGAMAVRQELWAPRLKAQGAVSPGLDMATERRRLARLDRRHDAARPPTNMTLMGRTTKPGRGGGRCPRLQRPSHGAISGRRHDLEAQPIERALKSRRSWFSPPVCSAPSQTGWVCPSSTLDDADSVCVSAVPGVLQMIDYS